LGQATLAVGSRFGRFPKLLAVTALLIAASGGLLTVRRAREDRRRLFTGPARWIWCTRQVEEPAPLRWRASRVFRLDGALPASVSVRLFGDRYWSLEVNGEPVASGEQTAGDPLRVLDLSGRLRAGENRISIEASSANGVGGLLFWMDLGGGRLLVSDETWEAEMIPAGGQPKRPAVVWGEPPMHPWGYPALPGS
jgi:hypothetical protein